MKNAKKRTVCKTFLAFAVAFNFMWMFSSYDSLRARFIGNGTGWDNLRGKPYCSDPYQLVGELRIDFNEMEKAFEDLNQSLAFNNSKSDNVTTERKVFESDTCSPRRSVAIIIPFRDRETHLRRLLGHLHPILQRQLRRYQIFVIEQVDNGTFNKGRLMNTGFEYARREYGAQFDCFIFHDVDMLPENDKNIYRCDVGTNMVRHLSCSVNKFDYKTLCCGMTIGGVVSFSEEQFLQTNGFPNDYWGWGGEDDDMNSRIKINGLKVVRPPFSLCRYFMIDHERDKLNPYAKEEVNSRVNSASKRSDSNGLNNLKTLIKEVEKHPLYIKVYVDVGTPGPWP